MARRDRLFDLLQILRDGEIHRAQDLAARLKVTTRTIWRDMDRLIASGVPVEAVRGVGYRMREVISLPPMTLTPQEVETLTLGLAVVAQAGDEQMRAAADALSAKIESNLPTRGQPPGDSWTIGDSPFSDATRNLAHMPLIRAAIKARQKLRITYTALEGVVTSRVIRPLQLDFWGKVWSLTAWCDMRAGFRVFRLDLIESADALPELFVDEPGKRIEDYAP